MTTPDQFVTIAPPDPTPTTQLLLPLTWRDRWELRLRIWADWIVRNQLALALIIVLSLALGAALTLRQPAEAGARSRAQLAAPTPPLAVPTAATGPVLPVRLIAYDAPGGAALGDLQAGWPYAVIAQAHGGAWLQIDAGSGPVWVEASAWGEAPIVRAAALADLTPPTPVPPPTPAPRPAIVYVQAPAPGAPPAQPAPPQPTEAPAWHPPFVSGYDPAAAAPVVPVVPAGPDCPLVLSPERLEACLAGEPLVPPAPPPPSKNRP